jgi:hypothetical protein
MNWLLFINVDGINTIKIMILENLLIPQGEEFVTFDLTPS